MPSDVCGGRRVAKPVQLSNGRRWQTQGAAKAHFKEVLNRYSDGDRVTSPADHGDLLALLEAYDASMPQSARKAGVGVDHFYRAREQEHNGMTSCFYVMRTDGSAIDFSYIKAVETASRT